MFWSAGHYRLFYKFRQPGRSADSHVRVNDKSTATPIVAKRLECVRFSAAFICVSCIRAHLRSV